MIRAIRIPTIFTIVLTLALAVLPARALAQSEAPTDEAADAITGTVWAVVSLGPSPPATDQSVRFEPDGGLLLSTGCADYTGTYVIAGDRLSVDSVRREFGSIEECTFGESGSADTFVNLMEAAETWSIDDGGQLIIGAGGRYEGWTLTLGAGEAMTTSDDATPATSIDPAELDRTWRLQTIDLGPAGQATMPAQIEITLALAPDGALSGSGSCSDYAGDYTVIGSGAITITDVSAAETEGCQSELADLQQLYLGLLPVMDAVRVETDGALVLSAAAISAELTFEPGD